jgi:hypothetical protein
MVIVYLQTVRRVKGSDRGEALQEMIVFMKKDRRAVYDSLRKKAEDLLKIKFLNSDSDQLADLDVSDFVKLFHELDAYKIELELMNEEIDTLYESIAAVVMRIFQEGVSAAIREIFSLCVR